MYFAAAVLPPPTLRWSERFELARASSWTKTRVATSDFVFYTVVRHSTHVSTNGGNIRLFPPPSLCTVFFAQYVQSCVVNYGTSCAQDMYLYVPWILTDAMKYEPTCSRSTTELSACSEQQQYQRQCLRPSLALPPLFLPAEEQPTAEINTSEKMSGVDIQPLFRAVSRPVAHCVKYR